MRDFSFIAMYRGAANRTTAKYCEKCGVQLDAQPRPRAGGPELPLNPCPQSTKGERRHLTVLFCDLVGSTEIAAKLDPEDWREVLTLYHRAVTESVARFGGYVAQYLGDGLLAFFGYPQAHDEDPQRAVLAGLGILDAVSALNGQLAKSSYPRLATRIGIDTGSVVVDDSNSKGANVFGEVPNTASRVQNAAAPDTVLITTAAYRLISGLFVVEDKGAQLLKGIDHPEHLNRVVQASGVRGRLAAAAEHGLTPFIGRDDELRLLMNRWEQARDGEGQTVLIVGEAGIGKSRDLSGISCVSS
jgi:class 3 adenylate cyclase